MKKLIPFFAAALCGLFASCANVEVRVPPPSRMIADVDPVELGELIVFTEKFFSSSLDKGTVTLFYNPRTDELQMHYRNSTGGKVQLHLSFEARKRFVDSFAEYNSLYENKTLKNTKNSAKAFGTSLAVLKWGGVMSLDAEGLALLEYGYAFKDGSPWYVLGVPVTQNEKYNEIEMNYSKNSSPRNFFFNRAKAAEFAALMDQATLEALVQSPLVQDEIPDTLKTGDDY